MGHRLSKIYTCTGDDGTTGLGDGSRVAKHALRVAAYGDVDELNSAIGYLLSFDLPIHAPEVLLQIQHRLFDLGGELSIPGHELIVDQDVVKLEAWIDQYNESLPPLKEFILPGGGNAGAFCHLARTIARRAERSVTELSAMETVNSAVTRYLNRLSDLLFVLARSLNRAQNHPETLWQRKPDSE